MTGSADGIGRQTALDLIEGGHQVVVHARNDQRAADAREAVPGADAVVVGDLSSQAQTRALADAAKDAGPFDAVIHNAGVGGADERSVTEDGLESQGEVHLDDLQLERRPWDGMQAYSDSKLWDVVLAFAVARRYPSTLSNAVDPGDPAATVSARYFHRRRELRANPAAYEVDVQEQLLSASAGLTGVQLPG